VRRPFAVPALAAVAGASIAAVQPAPPWIPAAGAVLAAIAAAVAPRRFRIPCLAAFALLAVWLRGEIAWRRPARDDVARRLTEEPVLGSIEGRVVAPPLVLERDIDHPPRRSTFVVELERARFADGWRAASGRLLVRLPGISPRLCHGDRVRCDGRLHRPKRPRSPGAADGARALRVHGIRAICQAETWGNVRRVSAAPPWHPMRLIGAVRARAAEALAASLPRREAAVAMALLLGERRDFPDDLRQRFQRCGTIHVFAISGAHVGVLAALARLVLGLLLGARPRAIAAALVAFVAAYALLTGAAPSVRRASWMIGIYVGADLLGKRRDPIHALAATLFLLLVLHPPDLLDVGFQLSFVAVGSLLLLTPRFASTRVPAWLRRPAQASAVSFAATAGTTPLSLWYFNLVAPAAIAANLFVWIPAGAVLSIGMAFLLSSVAAPPLQDVLSPALGLSIRLLVAVPRFFDGLPAGHFYLPAPPAAAVAGAYAILAITAWRARGRARWTIPGALLAAAVAVLSSVLRPPGAPEIAILDVGQGLSTYLRLPSGTTLLYDAGSSGYPEVGTRIVAPFLWERGVRRLDWLVLSHEHADHLNAAAAIAERFSIGAVAVATRFGEHVEGEGARALRRLSAMGIPIRRLRRGDAMDTDGGLERIAVLHPPHLDGGDGEMLPFAENDASLTLLVEAGATRVLLPGDLQEAGCTSLLESGADLSCEILVVPHHGGRCERLPELLEAAKPQEAFLSARRSFPSSSTIAELEARRIRWSATYEAGTISRPLRR
jgi:competence protein ComEC